MMARLAVTPQVYPYSDLSTRTFSLGIAALGSIWLSGCTAGRLDRASGKTLIEGDLVAQARLALEKSRVVLEAGGLGLSDIVTIVQYVTPAALPDMPKLFAMYREVFGGRIPSVNTIVVRRLLRAKALIEIESVAGNGTGAGFEYLPFVSGKDRADAHGRALGALIARGLSWGDVVRSTELMTDAAFAEEPSLNAGAPSGLCVVMPRVLDDGAGAQIQMTASRTKDCPVLYLCAEGDPRAGGVEEQCREIYARLREQLSTAGSGIEWVVKTTEFVTPAGLAGYRGTADVRREVFAAPYPAATGVVCDRLMNPDAHIAVDVVAIRKAA